MAPRAWVALCLVVLLSQSPSVLSKRALLQSDAISNSNGCLATISKCEQGACATRNIMGTARWVCLRCLANYEPVVDSSGQQNIVQCVCPRGFYEPAANATRCSRCEAGSYCPGGDKAENPTSRGSSISCGANLVTRNTGARTPADCVAPAGFAQSAPGAASPCARSEYAPQFNRLARCLRCQSGLEEPAESGLANSQRSNKKDVCKVPPGRYMSQGLVRWCPQGFYRENYTNFDAAVSQICLACRPGITTQAAGSKLASDCNKVLLGYGIQTLTNVSSADQVPALPADASGGLPEATLCGIGYYSAGGYCVNCPYATVTRNQGAKSVEECVVPPGYFISSAAAALAPCGPGSYRERWVMFSDARALACTPCGQGILSEPRDLDENPLAANGSYARATSASCYIEAGQGMIAIGANSFSGSDCPANTYGAAGKVYGLTAAPCKPCPRNMITDGLTRVNNSDACVNPDGFGYASEGASRCAPGFYSLKGSRKPCQRCPYGRITANDPALQRLFTDCYVREGFGLVSSTGNTTDGTGYVTDPSGLTDEVAAVTPVMECPIGYWGAGLSIRAVCTKCPTGSTTDEIARTAVEQCSICIPGYGIWESSACTPCNYGWYHPGGDTKCTQCPVATFYPPVDGVGATWASQGITFFKGAQGIDFCLPKESQLSPDAGQIYFSAAVLPELTLSVPQPSLAACIATCPPDSGCMVQFDVAAGVCHHAALPWDPAGPSSPAGTKLQYKLPPGTLTAASSIKGGDSSSSASSSIISGAALLLPSEAAAATTASGSTGLVIEPTVVTPQASAAAASEATRVRAKMMASGFYARLAISADKVASWLKAGVPLDPQRAQTFKWGAAPEWDQGRSEEDCQRKCDDSVVCWGFLYDTPSQSCLYRGGEDALRSRSFFVMPDMASVGSGALPPAPESPSPAPAASPSPAPAAGGDDGGNLPLILPTDPPSPSPEASPTPSLLPIPSPSPEPVPSPSPEPVPSPSPEPVPSPSPQPLLSPSPEPIPSPSPEPVPSPSPEPIPSPSPEPIPSPSPLPPPSPSPLPPPSPSPLPQPSPSPLPQPSPSPLPPPSPSPLPPPSPSPLPPPSPSPSPSPTSGAGELPVPIVPPSPSPRLSPSPSPTPLPSPSPSPIPVVSPSPSPRPPSPSPTPPPSPSPTPSPSPSPRPPSPSPTPPPSPSPAPSNGNNPPLPGPTDTGGVISNITGPVVFPNGTATVPDTSGCWDRCKKNTCCFLQYRTSTRRCSLNDMEVETANSGNGYGFGYRLVYKKEDNSRASLIGQVNSAQKFVRCKLQTEAQVNAYLQIGLNLDASRAETVVTDLRWDTTPNNEENCRVTCSKSMLCWGFIYHADLKRCVYRGGTDVPNLDFQTYVM